MKLTYTPLVKEEIFKILQECRDKTLELFQKIDEPSFCQQSHPDFSPAGWHLGHIGFTEAYWILEHTQGKAAIFPQYIKLFAADGLPKAERQNLPSLREIKGYLEVVRDEVFAYLKIAPLDQQETLWRWLIQHESQHSEIIAFVLELQKSQNRGNWAESKNSSEAFEAQMREIPEGSFLMGSNDVNSQDNEKPAHQVYLDKYWIDQYPVTCIEYRQFMEAGGYETSKWWSEKGWQWLKTQNIRQPLYWSDHNSWDHHPVCGVSCHEAEAYANFVGKRLPTEAEWEKAAMGAKPANYNLLVGETSPVNSDPHTSSIYGCYHMLGNVWEWTSSNFNGYSGFVSYPYKGYSMKYFDNQHRVLKGGSWATRPWALRATFRNWYHPEVRQILGGFRCVSS